LYTGPLKQTYQTPNNLTNHSAFQESYKSINWEHFYISDMQKPDYLIQKSDMPIFYEHLANDSSVQSVIEYPVLIADHVNKHYFYQHYHKKRIISGYIIPINKKRDYIKLDDIPENIDDGFADADVLIYVSDETLLKFTNMLNILDFNKLKESDARYVILHQNAFSEVFLPKKIRKNIMSDKVVEDIVLYYKQNSWQPVFYDQDIVVFDINNLRQIDKN
jgi:hypothetical protein